MPGFEPGPHWWEACALTTAPPLLLINMSCQKWRSNFKWLLQSLIGIRFIEAES